MTIRAIILGILLGLAISAFNYFNDQVIRQTFLIGNHLPAAVFGTGLLLLLAGNPLLRLAGNLIGKNPQRAGPSPAPASPPSLGDRWVLKPGEVGIILALGLAVCAWPGSNLLRYFSQMMALPAYRLPTQPAWLSNNVMSYVPGQSSLLAEGYVSDWDALLDALASGASGDAPEPVRRVWERLDGQVQRLVLGARRPLGPAERDAVVRGLNAVIGGPALAGDVDGDMPAHELERANRAFLQAALPGLLPPPEGSGVLLQAHGHETEVIDALVMGAGADGPALHELPWGAWWPSLRLWGGALLCGALATLCLLVIVHPQWAHRELLRYPTVEFVHEMTRWRPGRYLPDIASSRLFWIGVVPVAILHLVNGMHAYFTGFPQISRDFGFDPLGTIFTDAVRVPGANRLFHPTIFPSVIGFGYFVTTRVSLSIGLSLVFWTILGAWLLGFGTPLDNNALAIGSNGNALRFGAYIAMTIMLAYFGRRYYWNVAKASIGLPRAADTPRYAVWAARGLVFFSALCVWFLVRYANLSPLLAVAFVLLFLMMLLVLARINAETGLFYAQPDWMPSVMLAGVLGLSGVGAENLAVLLIAGLVFAADPREGLGPYVANGLRLGDRVDHVSPRGLAPWLALMIVVGLVVAMGATLWLQYNRGLNLGDWFATNMPVRTIDRAAASIAELDARGELSAITRLAGLEHLAHAKPDATTLGYAGVGFALLLGCAIARIRLPWWPIHPVLFLVWGTYPANYFAASFLLAAAVKAGVTKVGGAKAYDDAKPLMVGLIVGDILMIIVWSIVGTIYYLNTNHQPPSYLILPV